MLEHLDELVVKAVGESGGYGMLMGPMADQATLDDFRERLRADPRNYIAQPRRRTVARARAATRSGSVWSAATSTCGPTASTTASRSRSCPAA